MDPTPVTLEGARVRLEPLALSHLDDLCAVGLDTDLWRYTQTSGGPANIATPVAKGNYIYSTNARRFGGGLVQLNSANGGVAAEQVYFERDVPNTLGGQVLLGNYLYGTNQEGPVAAEFTTGKILWKAQSFGPAAVSISPA